MSHTLHRRGTLESLKNDYVVFAMSAKGINEVGSNVKLRRFLEIVNQYGPVNLGDMKTGNRYIRASQEIIDKTSETSIVHGVFDNRESLIKALQALKDEDLGISIIVSGLMGDVQECCQEAGVKRHTCEASLGIWGKTERLPDEDLLRFTTMCGHGQVPFNLVKKMITEVKEGRLTVGEAAEEMAKPCQCGVFNLKRAEAMLEDILCLWGIRVA
jgi:hypothetical protein